MQPPPTRHSPCPCGSGKMYKHCHGKAAPLYAVDDDRHDQAIARAMRFLAERHRKAFQTAHDDELKRLIPLGAPQALLEEIAEPLAINLGERVLAEGKLFVRGQWCSIAGHLLGPDGPNFTRGERRWIEQLGHQPLRLYTVTDVRPGEGLTLADAIDIDAEPIVVKEVALSKAARPGMLFGLRLMDVGDHWELSGALYPFSLMSAGAVTEAAKEIVDEEAFPDEKAGELSHLIACRWLEECLGMMPLPDLRDASTGEPMLLIADYYQVLDDAALARVLAACDDVVTTEDGWIREQTAEDGITRPLAHIRRGRKAGRIDVSYRTQALAEEGHAWLAQLTGSAVRRLTRGITDPKAVLTARRESRGAADASASLDMLPAEIDSGDVSAAIEQFTRRHYAHWADEPIPMLGGKTPRQAIATSAGLERVKGLLRSYADGEAEMARQQNRAPISYQFLWDELGITR